MLKKDSLLSIKKAKPTKKELAGKLSLDVLLKTLTGRLSRRKLSQQAQNTVYRRKA